MHTYTDSNGNTWRVEMAEPDPMPIHPGIATHHWRVTIETPDGGRISHGDQNLAAAIAECVAKGDVLKDARSTVKRLIDELRWRVEEHHCDGENLDGDELEAFHAVEALLID